MNMLRPLKTLTLSSCLIAGTIFNAAAQFYVPPIGPEFIYGDPSVGKPQSISCYAFRGLNTPMAFGQTDVYLAAWTNPDPGAVSEVTWQFSVSGSPTALLYQGSQLYTDVADLEVGAMRNLGTNTTQIYVAYYKLGSGHFVDIYDITTSPFNPVVYNTTMNLSSSPTYGRIRMDSHSTELRDMVIVWEEPGVGIRTMAGRDGTWYAPKTLDNTFGEAGPDVAFCRTNNGINVHYVHHKVGMVITESVVPYSALLGGGSIVYPSVEDVNVLSNPLRSRLMLDAPDDYNVDNWAYTYTDNHIDISVQYMDHNTSSTAGNVSVSSGALGNVGTAGSLKVFTPTIHYGMGALAPGNPGATDQIHVGWYSTDGIGFNRYIALEMNESGSSLISPADYLDLPSGSNATTYPLLPYTGIAFSKGDLKYAPDYMYAVYYDYDGPSGQFNLHHAFHDWGTGAFKGTKDLKAGTGTYPNPFNETINTSVTLKEAGVATVELFDITGKVIAQTKASLTAGTHSLQLNGLQNITPGVYFINTTINGLKTDSKAVVKQQ